MKDRVIILVILVVVFFFLTSSSPPHLPPPPLFPPPPPPLPCPPCPPHICQFTTYKACIYNTRQEYLKSPFFLFLAVTVVAVDFQVEQFLPIAH